jgi:hypothetical protein
MKELAFEAVRSDWYAANTLLPRLLVKAVRRELALKLVGFPVQWIPVCVHYGIAYAKPRQPNTYTPLFSDLPVQEVVRLAEAAKANNASRPLLEAAVALDPVIADLVYIVDHKLGAAGLPDPGHHGSNLLNTWHSFGRPEVINLQERMCQHDSEIDTVLFLPCSRQRPYDKSRTHGRLLNSLRKTGYDPSACAQVVVTAFGVVPQAYWRHPLIMTYDAGAVDLWRVFRLLRAFLIRNDFRVVIDCLSFKPFSDILKTLHEQRLMPRPIRPLKLRWRGFCVDLP